MQYKRWTNVSAAHAREGERIDGVEGAEETPQTNGESIEQCMEKLRECEDVGEAIGIIDRAAENNAEELVKRGVFGMLRRVGGSGALQAAVDVIHYSDERGAVAFLDEFGMYSVGEFAVCSRDQSELVAEVLLELARKTDSMEQYLLDNVLFPCGELCFDTIGEVQEITFLDIVNVVMEGNDIVAMKTLLKAMRIMFKKSIALCNMYGYHFINNIRMMNSEELSISYAKVISVLLDVIDLYKTKSVLKFVCGFLENENENVVISGIKLVIKLSEKEKIFEDDSIVLKMEKENIFDKLFDLIENGSFRIKCFGYKAISTICEKYPKNLFEQFVDQYNVFDLTLRFFINEIVYASDDLILSISKIAIITFEKIQNRMHLMNNEYIDLIEQSIESINNFLNNGNYKDHSSSLYSICQMLEILNNECYYLKKN